MNCLFCNKVAHFKEINSNRVFCGKICQIGMKRSKSYSSEDETDLNELGVFISIIRASGKCNMFDLNCIYISLICLLGYYSKSELVRYLIKNPNSLRKIMEEQWYDISSEKRTQLFEIAKATDPYGFDFLQKYKEFKGKPNDKLDKIIQYLDEHDFGLNERTWAEGIVNIAEELCFEKGVFARDVAKIDSLKRQYDVGQLKMYGAQLL